ncbi:MAG: hypothetical protein H0A76_04615 [Candidatus Thiodubiliella endoseptemdiera]|uniref:Uncharacterized protein n=1 Tax=Candidatus Thiodubiliella endoseptemdiera TaxID=2738886 RepID=A0A853F147_9GAMM|nr:hypothetical protein [Candidatus Thiodubiliella endoseptemdiera]
MVYMAAIIDWHSRLFYHTEYPTQWIHSYSDERTQRCFRKYPQRYLIPIKAVNTPVRCTPSDSKTGYYYLNGRQRQSHR